MLNVDYYLNDGANWQAQCVLSYIRDLWKPHFEGHRDIPVEIKVGRFENAREQGYVFTLYIDGRQTRHYAVYEHRNTDELIVLKQDGFSMNTPSVEFMFGGRGKYGYDKSFNYGEIIPCGDWIMNDMKEIIKNKENEKE